MSICIYTALFFSPKMMWDFFLRFMCVKWQMERDRNQLSDRLMEKTACNCGNDLHSHIIYIYICIRNNVFVASADLISYICIHIYVCTSYSRLHWIFPKINIVSISFEYDYHHFQKELFLININVKKWHKFHATWLYIACIIIYFNWWLKQ